MIDHAKVATWKLERDQYPNLLYSFAMRKKDGSKKKDKGGGSLPTFLIAIKCTGPHPGHIVICCCCFLLVSKKRGYGSTHHAKIGRGKFALLSFDCCDKKKIESGIPVPPRKSSTRSRSLSLSHLQYYFNNVIVHVRLAEWIKHVFSVIK